MNFCSIEYLLFFGAFFAIYWLILQKHLRFQNAFILLASYFFYGWWDWRFLSLIFISSLCDYLVGIALDKTDEKHNRKILLAISLAVNLGILGFFKYFNFFIESFESLLGISQTSGWTTLDVILPVGISFYTLQTLSYTFDVYDRKIKSTSDPINFFAYVSFFPQLLAGPIERANRLLPQFKKERIFQYDQAADGVRQILWGLFKKMVIADNCGIFIDTVFSDYASQDASTLLLTSFLVIIQFYCDFSGYSDIAIGSARLLGFNLMKNFDFPFFSRNMSEFWNKWHISLISWLRDYLLRGLKGFSRIKLFRNVIIVFVTSGLWHGANWTFILWGFYHALLFAPLIFWGRVKYRNVVAHGKWFPSLRELYLMGQTVTLFAISAIMFRSTSVSDAYAYFVNMLSFSIFSFPSLPSLVALNGILLMFVVEWLQREKEHGLDFSGRNFSGIFRWTCYFSLLFIIVMYGGDDRVFAYFQF